MANIEEAFNAKFENTVKLNNHNDVIDHFFTQRRVTEHEDIIDKNMNRKKKKKDTTYNFIAITIPYYEYIESNEVEIEVKIWGDETSSRSTSGAPLARQGSAGGRRRI